MVKNLGILLSGRGSNFEAIARNVQTGKVPARIALVISNRSDAPGLRRAREMGLNAPGPSGPTRIGKRQSGPEVKVRKPLCHFFELSSIHQTVLVTDAEDQREGS